MKPIIFSGTTEGRTLSEKLTASGIAHIVCVATEYGELVMEPSGYADIRRGRLSGIQMYDLVKSEGTVVFDATHPYAAEVSRNIRNACLASDHRYVRILRDTDSELFPEISDVYTFADAAECAEALKDTEGNILLTTGSKELAIYSEDEEVRSRLFARVLPSHESISLCEEAGLKGKQIIAMQGPFSKETDLALIRQFGIRTLVTKSSGSAGGAPDKLRAAAEAGIQVFMIGRPAEETGISVNKALSEYFGIREKMQIDLIGTGPGRLSMMTGEASEAVSRADMIFGARRMISGYEGRTAYPYYRADEIIPVLEEKMPERAAILFSGDTGFYSGAASMTPALRDWAQKSDADITVRIHPGISSFAYLAARAGLSYQNAALVSIHGHSDDARAASELIRAVNYNKETFVLLSGPADVRLLGRILEENGLGHVHIILGYQMSYPEENIGLITCRDCVHVDEKGLYTAAVINDAPEVRPVMPVISDTEMIRDKVPMTKESIRHLSVLRLGMGEGSIVYDIGSGTGSVACEIARLDPAGKVYAIEKKEEACSLIRKNAENLGLANIEVIQGLAPDAFDGLERPTHAFIGGSSGNLKDILRSLGDKSPGIRVVINAVSLETMAEVTAVIREMKISDLTVEQVSVSRSRELGDYHLLTAENPVLIAAFRLESGYTS
ncbi:MAG: precorrin-6A reductase [Mogibacterium sp.]|nr:precorrin-6A reductase [Mogibacterium sp.]